MPGEKPLVVNNAPVVGWTFMTIWMAMLCAFTWLGVRDGGMPGYSAGFSALFLGAFWLFGLAGCSFFLKVPRVRVMPTAEGLRLEEIWFWNRRRLTPLTAADASRLAVVDDKDSEGDPYFRCEIELADGRRVTVRESHLREIVEEAGRTLAGALSGDEGRRQ